MIIFGHLGIGLAISRPFLGGAPPHHSKLPIAYLMVGALLPDVIDKTLFYLFEIGSGTRLYGHAAIFAFGLVAVSFLLRSKKLASLSLGFTSHIVLDHLGDAIGLASGLAQWNEVERKNALSGLLWPFLGDQFPVFPFDGAKEHVASFAKKTHLLIFEVFGLAYLLKVYGRTLRTRLRGR